MLNAKLVVVGGGDAKINEIKLKLPTTIGRSREAKLKLPHPLVSRKHCEVFEKNGQLFVRDLGSLNGTYVDSHKIESEHVLAPNQLLTLGTVTFRAVYDPAQPSLDDATAAVPTNLDTVGVDNGHADLLDKQVFSEADTERDGASDTDTNLPVFKPEREGKNSPAKPEAASSIFVDAGLPSGNGSVSLSEIAKLPAAPAALSFTGGIQIDNDRQPAATTAPAPDSLPTIDLGEAADRGHTRRKRPR